MQAARHLCAPIITGVAFLAIVAASPHVREVVRPTSMRTVAPARPPAATTHCPAPGMLRHRRTLVSPGRVAGVAATPQREPGTTSGTPLAASCGP